jgi:hypothetical protein
MSGKNGQKCGSVMGREQTCKEEKKSEFQACGRAKEAKGIRDIGVKTPS